MRSGPAAARAAASRGVGSPAPRDPASDARRRRRLCADAHETVDDLIDRALEAYAALELLGEEIEDEWTYVTDLEDAWRDAPRRRGRRPRGAEAVRRSTAAAIDRAIDEIGLITDPHRAIDWLSTFPQVVLRRARGGP